jgi:hypothetical protein
LRFDGMVPVAVEFCEGAAKVCEFFTGARLVSAWIQRVANGAARLQRGACAVGVKRDSPRRRKEREEGKDHRPGHNLLTMRLMPSLMRTTFQFTRKPSR